MGIHQTMRFDRSTPHKWRFHCDDENAALSDIYIRKEAYPKPPQTIALTINGID